jgi:UTP--glucose-1-phosphate uridylyltransferase
MKIKTAIIPVAGKGTRFYPITKSIMKTMLPIIDKPTVSYIMDEALSAGITHIVFVVGPNQTMLKDYLTILDSTNPVMKELNEWINHFQIDFVEQTKPNGLGDAILCAKPLIKEDAFAVMLGDDLVQEAPNVYGIGSLCDAFEKVQTTLLGVKKVPMDQTNKYGIIEASSYEKDIYPIMSIVEKPTHAPSQYAVLGRYIFTKEVFESLQVIKPCLNGELQLTDAIFDLIQKGTVYATSFAGNRFDIGSKEGYLLANLKFGESREPYASLLKSELGEKNENR